MAFAAVMVVGLWLAQRGGWVEWLRSGGVQTALESVRDSAWAPLALVGSFVVVAPFGLPVSPLILAGGAVFGPWLGWFYNWLGCALGAFVSYGLAQWLGRDLVVRWLGEHRLQQLDTALDRHGFWTLFRLRFLPIPFVLINFGAALSGIRFGPFALSTALAHIPTLAVYTYLGHLLLSAATEDRAALLRQAALALVLLFTLTLTPPLWRRWRRRQLGRDATVDDDKT